MKTKKIITIFLILILLTITAIPLNSKNVSNSKNVINSNFLKLDNEKYMKYSKTHQIQNNNFCNIFSNNIDIKDGWPIETELSIFSSPTIADLDCDNIQEIIVVTGTDYHGSSSEYRSKMRKIYVWDIHGNLKPGWPKDISSQNNRPPSIGDLDGDGDLEIVIFSRLKNDNYDDGFVYGWHHDGLLFDGWPKQFPKFAVGVPPMIADLENDNDPEIIVSKVALAKGIYLYDNNGNILQNWPRMIQGHFYGAVGNLDQDSEKEFVTTGVNSGDVGVISCFNKDGSILPGWPLNDTRFNLPDGQPVIGDLDKDCINEIIFPTMNYKVNVLNYEGDFLPNWPKTLVYIITPSLVLGDLNNDGELNIIGVEMFSEYDTARVHALDINGNELEGFPVDIFAPPEFEEDWLANGGSPIIVDIDGDGFQEIVCDFQQWGLDAPSFIYAINHDGTIKNDDIWPIYSGIGLWHQHSSLAAGDIDNDGLLELVSAYSKHNPDYPEIGYGGGEVIVYDFETPMNQNLIDWPMFQHDPQHSGCYEKIIGNYNPTVDIAGPKNGKPNEEYEYNFTLYDSDGDNVSFFVNWGDETTQDWIGPYESGEKVSIRHIWANKGNYEIKAKAKDEYGAESNWETFNVAIKRSRSMNYFFLRFLDHFLILKQILNL